MVFRFPLLLKRVGTLERCTTGRRYTGKVVDKEDVGEVVV